MFKTNSESYAVEEMQVSPHPGIFFTTTHAHNSSSSNKNNNNIESQTSSLIFWRSCSTRASCPPRSPPP
jgi:hypothetical protein